MTEASREVNNFGMNFLLMDGLLALRENDTPVHYGPTCE